MANIIGTPILPKLLALEEQVEALERLSPAGTRPERGSPTRAAGGSHATTQDSSAELPFPDPAEQAGYWQAVSRAITAAQEQTRTLYVETDCVPDWRGLLQRLVEKVASHEPSTSLAERRAPRVEGEWCFCGYPGVMKLPCGLWVCGKCEKRRRHEPEGASGSGNGSGELPGEGH